MRYEEEKVIDIDSPDIRLEAHEFLEELFRRTGTDATLLVPVSDINEVLWPDDLPLDEDDCPAGNCRCRIH